MGAQPFAVSNGIIGVRIEQKLVIVVCKRGRLYEILIVQAYLLKSRPKIEPEFFAIGSHPNFRDVLVHVKVKIRAKAKGINSLILFMYKH